MWLAVLVIVLPIATAATLCTSNCTGNLCLDGACVCAYPSNAADCSTHWLDSAAPYLIAFVTVFALAFLVTLVWSAVQLMRLLYYTGAKPNVPKLLHVVIFLQSCLRVAWFFTAGLDVLNNIATTSLMEGIIDGMGIAALVVCYLLAILLWLQVYHQVSTGSAQRHSWVVRHRTGVVTAAIVVYVIVEVVMRVLWTTDQASKMYLIAMYHVVVLVATLACTVSFGVLSVLLYRQLRDVNRTTPATRERVNFVVRFTTFTVILSALTLAMTSIFFAVELATFKWKNWTSWLVEQVLLRSLEASYAIGTLIALRKIPPHEVKPERRGLLADSPVVVAGAVGGVHRRAHDLSDDSFSIEQEDDFVNARKRLAMSNSQASGSPKPPATEV